MLTNDSTGFNDNPWTWPFEPPPGADADIRARADYVEDLVAAYRFPTNAHGDVAPADRRILRAACEGSGYTWATMVKELRRRELARGGFDPEASDVTYTERGIPVDQAALARLKEAKLGTLCPFVQRLVDLHHFQLYRVERQCGSWPCPNCAPVMADELATGIERGLWSLQEQGLEKLYAAQALWEPGLANRVAKRREAMGMSTITYQSAIQVFYLADRPLTGDAPPTSSRIISIGEAVQWLIEEAMWVPGHVSHQFIGIFELCEPQGKTVSTGSSAALVGFTDSECERLMEAFYRRTKERFGLDIQSADLPFEVREQANALLGEMIDQAKKNKKLLAEWVR
jgi:hypothetical protein